ncbi:MAG: hypothetical protein J6038_04955 [Bacilli bacterium]|nr:hypothetical protein [Bacilli bacterium]
MNKKTFIQIIRSLVHFYGVIDEKDAYKVVKSYYPEMRKGEFLERLKERSGIKSRDYLVVNLEKKHFLIALAGLSKEELSHALKIVPEMELKILRKEEFFSYADDFCPNPPKEYRELVSYILPRLSDQVFKYIPKEYFIPSIWHRLRFRGYDAVMADLVSKDMLGIEDNKSEKKVVTNLLLAAHNKTPLPCLRGNTPLEFNAVLQAKGIRVADDALKASLQDFLDEGISSIAELREAVLTLPNLDDEMREQLLKQLDELQEENSIGKA